MSYATVTEAFASTETLVFGHRGAMAYAPMNTAAAFQRAIDLGAHGAELDVQLSRDGRLVIVHDATVDATTNGSGAVADLTLAELKALDAGSWFGAEFAGETIPTLDEVFARFGSELLINVEIKPPRDDSGALERAVADCIAARDMTERVIVSSFDPGALRRFGALNTTVMIGFLHGPAPAAQLDARIAGIRHEARHPWHEAIDRDFIERAREQGCLVNAWTVNDAQRACELAALGVSVIITDAPDKIVTALASC